MCDSCIPLFLVVVVLQRLTNITGTTLRDHVHVLMEERKHEFVHNLQYSEFYDNSLQEYFLANLNESYYKNRIYTPRLYEDNVHASLLATLIPFECI